MLTAASSSSSSSSAFLSESLVTPPKKYHASASSPAGALHPREWLSFVNFTKTSRTEFKPFLARIRFRHSDRFLFHCSCINSSTTLYSEMKTVTYLQEMGLNEKETESLLGKSPALRVTSLEKIRARIHSLQSLGIKGIALNHLIIKCPNVLLSEEIDSFICYIRNDIHIGGKIEPTLLERLLTSTETSFLVGFEEKVNLLIQNGVPQEKIVHVLNNINLSKALCLKPVEEIERTITYLNPFGGTDLIVRRPAILNHDLKTQLIPRINFLNKLSGGDVDATATVLRRFPIIISYSVDHVKNHVEFFKTFAGLNEEEIFKIIVVFPSLISASRERKLRPRIEFLKECGLDSNDIFKFLTKAPLFLALSFEENIVHKLVFLVKIGYRYRTKELVAAIGAVTRTSCENMQKVIGVFLDYGFSFADIFVMSKKHPQILQYNSKSLEEKMEYLVEDMGREIGELLAFPAFLGYKLDDRIKHRYEEKRKILGEGMSINKLLSVSKERFSVKKNKDHVHS